MYTKVTPHGEIPPQQNWDDVSLPSIVKVKDTNEYLLGIEFVDNKGKRSPLRMRCIRLGRQVNDIDIYRCDRLQVIDYNVQVIFENDSGDKFEDIKLFDDPLSDEEILEEYESDQPSPKKVRLFDRDGIFDVIEEDERLIGVDIDGFKHVYPIWQVEFVDDDTETEDDTKDDWMMPECHVRSGELYQTLSGNIFLKVNGDYSIALGQITRQFHNPLRFVFGLIDDLDDKLITRADRDFEVKVIGKINIETDRLQK